MAESLTKGGFTLTPKTGTGNAKVSISCSERTGRVATSPVTFTAKMDGFSVSKSVSVVQEGKAEFVTLTSATAVSVPNKGKVISITGITNSSKLVIDTTDFGMAEVYSTYTANGATAMNNVAIEGDPGASNEFTFTAQVNVKENPNASSRTATITITTAGGQKATVLLTQLASTFTYDLTLAASPTSIQADGGSSTITGKYKTFRNGVLINTEDVTPTCSIPSGTAFTLSSNKVSAPNRGTTAGELRSVQVSASYGNASSTITVSQAANQVESSTTTGGETIYNPVTAGAISNKTIPASGGSATATAGDGSQSWTTNKKYRHDTYTSGSVADVLVEDSKIGTDTIKPSVASISGSAESKGTIKSDITTVKEQAVTWTGNGGKKATGTMYIYQAANAEDYIKYFDPVINSFTVSDIPASGGSISKGSVTYEQARSQYFTSGAYTSMAPLTTGGTITYSAAVSASSLGTTVKDRASVGTLTVTVTMNGKSGSKDVTVYQEKNEIINYGDVQANLGGFYPEGGNPMTERSEDYTFGAVPSARCIFFFDIYQTITYTSGATREGSITRTKDIVTQCDDFSVDIDSSADDIIISANENKSESKLGPLVVKITGLGEGGKSLSTTGTVYQAAGVKTYAELVVDIASDEDIPAAGGSVTPTVAYSQTWGWNGATTGGGTLTSGGTVTFDNGTTDGTVSAESLGTTLQSRSLIKTVTATVTMNGKSASKTYTIYQAINKVVAIKAHQSDNISSNIHVEYPTEFISAAGGTVDPIAEGQLTVTCSSGSTVTTGSNGDFLTGTANFTRTFSGTAAGFTVNETSGVVEASNRGTTIGDARSVDVTSKLTVTFTNPASVGGNSVTDIISCVNTVTQAANSVTYGTVTVLVTPNPVSILAAGAIYNIKPTTSQTVSFTSGATRAGSIGLSYVAKNTVTGFSNNGETVTVQPNTTTSPRKGFIVTVTASGEGSKSNSVDVTFNQAAAAAYLNVDPATISIAADATSASFNIESNDSWTIS